MKKGDKVLFGAYGDFDNAKTCTIVDIKNGVFCDEYTLQGESGNTFTAYPDEIRPI